MTYKEGNLFKTVNGNLGIFVAFGNQLFPIVYSDYEIKQVDWDDISEIRDSDSFKVTSDNWSKAKVIYPTKAAFLGVSYEASPREVLAVKSNLIEDGYKVIEWDNNLSLSENEQLMKLADKHVIVPPADFHNTHIIGLGLYNQYLARKAVNKPIEISVSGNTKNVLRCFTFQDGDYKNTALVIY